MPRKNQFPGTEDELNQIKKIFAKMPDVVGSIAVDTTMDSFSAEQFQDQGSQKWAPRKNDKDSGKARDKRRALLVDSGDLRRSIDYESRPGEVAVGTDVKYAQRHNEGLKGMPQRQFMGESSVMDKKVEDWMDKEVEKVFG